MIWFRTDGDLRLVEGSADWPGWARRYASAAANGGGIGSSVWDIVPDEATAQIIRHLLARVREGHHARFSYRYWTDAACHDVAVHIDPAADDGFVFTVVHLREALGPGHAEAHAGGEAPMICLCAWCGRARRGGEWVAFEEFVRDAGWFVEGHIPNITHGICEPCAAAMTGTA